MARRPIFIGGMYKSGTSLLRAMIGQHPDIASGLETYWFEINWDGRDSDTSDIGKRLDWLAEFYGVEPAAVCDMAARSGSATAFLSLFLDSYAARENKSRWAEKTPGNIRHMDRILFAWPDAQIVHIIRDPKDVFASLRQANKWDSISEFSDRWCNFLGDAQRFKRDLDLNSDRYLELRYEDLVEQPVETTKALFDFLKEDWSEEVASFSGKSDDFAKVLAVTGKASSTLSRLSQPLSSGRVGIWRDVVTEQEIAHLRGAIARRGLMELFEKLEHP